ncbi:hypothetical protein K5X82_00800 [Halosquirtibacter xylanolyticus]|uniref:4-fold beta flower protein n=1 Tax=Halosquirtibacter xylanolyticus TaxID=3374599 RepID=UPI0037493164|nr:hypothetical protein K5X82_00800 [Prolixibacteraceae bacterium]
MKRCVFAFIILISSLISKAQDEITLFNEDGECIAYIDTEDDDLPIFLWDGTPVAFIEREDGVMNVFGFNGVHLGWIDKSIFYNHDGEIVAKTKEAMGTVSSIEPYKSMKQITPITPITSFAPHTPNFSSFWADESFKLFLLKGLDD